MSRDWQRTCGITSRVSDSTLAVQWQLMVPLEEYYSVIMAVVLLVFSSYLYCLHHCKQVMVSVSL